MHKHWWAFASMNRRKEGMKDEATGRFLGLAILILSTNLVGCAGTWTSGRPIYPSSWPALDIGRGCPDLSGKYLAVSDEAAPLAYEPGDHPRQMIFFVTFGEPVPLPPLGRRVLSWHLAGVFDRGDQEEWNALTMYATALEAAVRHAGSRREAGWVEVHEVADKIISVSAGLNGKTFLKLVLRNEAQGLWTNKSHVYQCEMGGIAIYGSFPPPPKENPTSQEVSIGAKFTFFRATDGSLVALEEAYTGVTQGNMVFKKWWRWRPIEK